jgi:hypothetical protein
VKTNVPFDHFRHECVHSTATGCGDVQHFGAIALVIQRLFNRSELTHDSPD